VFIIRQATIDDVPTLVKLARLVHFINLPADREIIYAKVVRSRECFIHAGRRHQRLLAPGRVLHVRA
jgi:hypothetical protein